MAEQRRLQAELTYRRTIEASSDAFIALDGDGGILRLNAAAAATFGWTNVEVRGRDVLDVTVQLLKVVFGQVVFGQVVFGQVVFGQVEMERW